MTLSPCRSQDVLTWRCSSNGKFSVRSAYHLQGTIKEDNKGQSSEQPYFSSFWNKLWGIQAPQTTKSFLWRAAKESLATNLNLHKRKVVESPLCPICFRYLESVSHALWTCAATQDVWSKSSRRIQKLDILNGSFKVILMPFRNQLSKRELTEIAVTVKAIWHRRNSRIFKKQLQSPSQVSKQVHAEMTTIAIDKDNSKVGIGVIVRDLDGLGIASLCSSITLTPNPKIGEAIAVRATTLCVELGLSQIILEEDALNVVQTVQHKEEN
ncbi:uncharacterized protein LOC122282244 [Carya illinoinensis]|uniref:uncharacterized protein LOC122282244 n=1 Tax=Carya illinoinensis TaxID=32201 RepID=UPI001C7205C7|nr:uncharacterized protein LOC122282244 [Carya illinoinensis]